MCEAGDIFQDGIRILARRRGGNKEQTSGRQIFHKGIDLFRSYDEQQVFAGLLELTQIRQIFRAERPTDIANSTFLSPRQLEQLFQAYYEESPIKYLQKMRMKKALTLLVRQETSVASAARHASIFRKSDAPHIKWCLPLVSYKYCLNQHRNFQCWFYCLFTAFGL